MRDFEVLVKFVETGKVEEPEVKIDEEEELETVEPVAEEETKTKDEL